MMCKLGYVKLKYQKLNYWILNIYHHPDPASGASDDWYKGVLNARFAYTVELRDTGRHGFVLPANQIIPRYGSGSLHGYFESMLGVLNQRTLL